ncbi:MAG: 2-oxoglutarate synthase, partial [Proteobacteria bacterium]|nr:2-oxoglutarate synthase [Pseudomonadota bacterium]
SLQTAAIVLSDQSLGQSRVLVDRPADISFVSGRQIQQEEREDYRRYAVNESGISPMAIPGTPLCQYTADGLEHTPTGTPSSRAEDHLQQMDKRQRKLEQFDYGDHWAEIEGEGETAVLTWGSSCSPVREAVELLRAEGVKIKLIAPRLLLPVQPERLADELQGVKRVLVIEQTHGAQFYRYLRAYYDLVDEVDSMAIPGPLAIRPLEVYNRLKAWESGK